MLYLEKAKEFVDQSVGPKPHFQNTLDWLLNLKPDADEALQIAAYCHDIERMDFGDASKMKHD